AYDVALATQLPLGGDAAQAGADGALLSWQGLPGSALGGFDMTMARPLLVDSVPADPYGIRSDAVPPPNTYLLDLPVAVGSTRSLFAQWWSFQPQETPYVLTTSAEGLLSGDLRNPLDVELEDVLVAYDRWAYRLEGPLAARGVIRIAAMQRRDLEW